MHTETAPRREPMSALAVALLAWPLLLEPSVLARAGSLFGPLLLLALAVLLATAASRTFDPLAIAAAALGALAAGWLAGPSLQMQAPAPLAALGLGVYFGRGRQLAPRWARRLHPALSLFGAVLAGLLAAQYSQAVWWERLLATSVAAVLWLLPFALSTEADPDDSLAQQLAALDGPDGERLREIAALCTRTEADLDAVAVEARGAVALSLTTLRKLLHARLALGPQAHTDTSRHVLARLDQRLDEHQRAVRDAVSSSAAEQAATLTHDDSSLLTVQGHASALEEAAALLSSLEPLTPAAGPSASDAATPQGATDATEPDGAAEQNATDATNSDTAAADASEFTAQHAIEGAADASATEGAADIHSIEGTTDASALDEAAPAAPSVPS